MHVFLHATMPAQLATHRPTIEINVPYPANQPAASRPTSQPATASPANQPSQPAHQPPSPPGHLHLGWGGVSESSIRIQFGVMRLGGGLEGYHLMLAFESGHVL